MTAPTSEMQHIDRAVAQLFTPDDARRVQALRALFVEQLDFAPATGAIQITPPPLHLGRGSSPSARLIARRDGVTVVFAAPGSDRVLGADALRDLYKSSARTLGDVLLVCSTGDSRHWQFIYPRQQDGREVLRRLSVQQGQPRRTFVEQLSGLVPNFASLGVKPALERLYDVEEVTKRFFAEYRRTFEAVLGAVVGLPDDEERRLFCQTLFNRLMFLYFLQRKGCLIFNGSADYLNAIWDGYTPSDEGSFYRTRLRPLFILALNDERSAGFTVAQQLLEATIGRVPFLNGGLFAEDDLDRRPDVDVPDEAIRRILTDLFNRFNFTITESTPYDVEVAVDPEMLGKVFEELVTGRHETGSYYTPRPIVSFMGKEALKGYLAHALPAETPEAVEGFVDDHSAADLRDPERALAALTRVRVCDPACGSGAYLLGMLQELLELRRCLFAAHRIGPEDVYNRKLEIIQDNLYGVDIDPFAVNIARLRLWLSLIVDYAGATPPPLPNLDFKIEQGDSLLAPSPEGVGQLGLRDALIPEFRAAKARYARAHGEEKRVEREHIERLQADIARATHPGKGQGAGFDWAVAFAEVFGEGGSDIILANPPYVRADENHEVLAYRRGLKQSRIYSTLYEKWDLYIAFLERGYQLLAASGVMVFIIPDAYTVAKYAQCSRQFMARQTEVRRVDFCSDLPIFQAGVRNVILMLQKRVPAPMHVPTLVRHWGTEPGEFETNSAVLPAQTQVQLGEHTFREGGPPTVVQYDAVRLEDICYISKGMALHANERLARGLFKAEDLVRNTSDENHPKPYLEGKDLGRWLTTRIQYLEWGTKRAPSLFSRPTFPQLFTAPEKLISIDIASGQPRVCYDDRQLHHNHSAWSFVPWYALVGVRNKSIAKTAKYRDENGNTPVARDRAALEALSRTFSLKYVLAVMNSRFAREFLLDNRRSKLHLYPDDWKRLPIPRVPREAQQPIVDRVDRIIALCRDGRESHEAEIAELETELDAAIDALAAQAVASGGAE